MNNKLRVLTLALLKNSYSFPQDSKKRLRQMVLFVVIVASFAPLAFSMVKLVTALYDALAPIGEEGAILSLGIAIGAFVIFFFGLFYTMNTFYFSEDIENLLPLPVKSSQILGAKFIIVTIYEYITGSFIFLPMLIIYGQRSGAGVLYYLYGLLIFLALPVIPIALDSVIVMIIMRFTNLAKNKDIFRIISAVIAIGLAVGLSQVSQKFTIAQASRQLQLGHNSLVNLTSNIFPVAKLGALGLINHGEISGLIYTGLFVLSSLLGFYVFLLLGNALYYKGVTGVSVASSSRRQLSGEELRRQTVRSSALKSYVVKELRLLFRTPAYFINCILMNFLWPVLLVVPLLTQRKSRGIGGLEKLLQSQGGSGIALAAVTGVILFISASNAIAATSISREGDNIFFIKFIPLSYKRQIRAKVLSGVMMGVIAMVLMLVVFYVLLKLPLIQLMLMSGIGLLAVFLSNLTGLIIDLFNPKLHWDNEQRAVKQNLNLLLSMVLCVVFGGLTVFAVVKLTLSLAQTAVGMAIVYGLLDLLLYTYLMKKGPQLFNNIEP